MIRFHFLWGCGCTGVVSQPADKVDSFKKWASTQICWDCQRKAKEPEKKSPELKKVVLDYRCGHSETIRVADSYLSGYHITPQKAKTMDCPKCRRQKEAQMYRQTSKAWGYPDLQGTEKQVNYALSIRHHAMDMICHFVETCECTERDRAEALANEILSQTSSRFWIEKIGPKFSCNDFGNALAAYEK